MFIILNFFPVVFIAVQDKMLLRVQTAKDEMDHIKNFNYGEVATARFASSWGQLPGCGQPPSPRCTC